MRSPTLTVLTERPGKEKRGAFRVEKFIRSARNNGSHSTTSTHSPGSGSGERFHLSSTPPRTSTLGCSPRHGRALIRESVSGTFDLGVLHLMPSLQCFPLLAQPSECLTTSLPQKLESLLVGRPVFRTVVHHARVSSITVLVTWNPPSLLGTMWHEKEPKRTGKVGFRTRFSNSPPPFKHLFVHLPRIHL